jgi:hypothetical protein
MDRWGSPNKVAGVVHKNEYVVPEKITSNPAYSGVIGLLEVARVRGYESGGFVTSPPVSPYSDMSRAPLAAPSSSALSSDPFAAINDLKDSFLTFAKAMDSRFDRIQVVNNVQDTMKQINVINKIQCDANV